MEVIDLSRTRDHAAHRGFCLAVGFLMLFAGAKPILFDSLDPDCFWHLRVGQRLCEMPHVGPIIDDLSFASVRTPWTPYSWLAEMAMWKIWTFGGFRAAIAVHSILQMLLALLLSLSALHVAQASIERDILNSRNSTTPASSRSKLIPALFGAGLALFVAMPFLSFRPATAAIVLLALCGFILARDRRFGEKTRAIWLIPLITLLTVNLHLFAAIIPVQVFALLASALWEWLWSDTTTSESKRRILRLSCLFALSSLACLATPMLPGLIETAIHYSRHDPMIGSPVISETQPIWRGSMGLATSIVIAAFLFDIIRKRKQLRCGELLWLGIGAVLLLKMARFAPIFALTVAGPIAATRGKLSDRVLTKPAIALALTLILALGAARVILAFPSPTQPIDAWLDRNGPDAPNYPCAAADWVQRNVNASTGRLINEFNWGGYLEWRLGSKYRTLMDGRTQLFDASFWAHTYLCGEPRRRDSLPQWNADAAIVPTKNSEFAPDLLDLGWTVAYQDPFAMVLTPPRQTAAHSQPAPSAAAMTDQN